MRFILAILVSGFLFYCEFKTSSNSKSQPVYQLVNGWTDVSGENNLGQPTGIGIDQDENIFVFHRAGRLWTDTFPDSLISQNTILEIDNESGKVLNSWGANYFIMPHGLTVDKQNNIWVTDVGLHQVFKFSPDRKLLMKLGIAKVPGNDSLHFNLPSDIAVADDGHFYVTDGYGNSRVVKFSPEGKYMKEWGRYGNMPGEFVIPHGIAIDKNHIIYVADRENNRVQSFDTSGNFLQEFKNDAQVSQLPSIAIDKANHLFAIDYDPVKNMDNTVKGSTIFAFDSSKKIKNRFGATGSIDRTSCWFHDLVIDSHGNIFAGDIMGMKVLKFRVKK